MKKILITAIAVSLAAATQVGAVLVTVSTVSGYNPAQGGGEFNVNPIIGTGYAPTVQVGGGFETFCLSRNISITIPGSYNATVNANGVYDLTATTTKTLTAGTAYLYNQFATGGLAGYRYGATGGGSASGRAQDAYYLQLAIWTLEGQYSYGSLAADLASNPFIAIAAALYGGGTGGLISAMLANNPGGFGVGSLDLTYANNVVINGVTIAAGTKAQPMLVLLPDGGTTLMLMGIGFSMLALVSRKFRA